MLCPMCGSELILVVRENPHDDFDNYEEPNIQTEHDESEWYKCDGCGCFGDNYPLVLHHPLRGMNSRPGDSWSLTWLK